MNENELRHLWDAETPKYFDRKSVLSDYPLPDEFLPLRNERVLDAGCGSGNYMGMYRQVTGDVIGLDFSSAMARAANRYGPTVQGDVQRLPFAAAQFDFVSSHVVLNHVVDGDAAFTELARVTRPGGRILIVVPNFWSFLAPMRFVLIRMRRYTLGLCRHYTVSQLRKAGVERELCLRAALTVPKPPTAPGRLRRALSGFGYHLDEAVHRIYPLWGGDLAVLFEKSLP